MALGEPLWPAPREMEGHYLVWLAGVYRASGIENRTGSVAEYIVHVHWSTFCNAWILIGCAALIGRE